MHEPPPRPSWVRVIVFSVHGFLTNIHLSKEAKKLMSWVVVNGLRD
jgi:hypothetical protein